MKKMKDSGIEYVGQIPVDWDVYKNKYIFNSDKNIVGDEFSNFQLLSLTTRGVSKKDINNAAGKLPESFGTYQSVKADDLVMCLFDLDVSAVFSGISKFDGMISPAYKILSCNEKLFPQFADYWFRAIGFDRNYLLYSKSLRNTINADNFKEIPTVVPPYTIQQKIANYLDEKVAHIDNIIEKTKESIEEYKKYKQSLITETVTKGLNPDAKMKDSGIEWIGEIPEHWGKAYLAQVYSQVKNKNVGIQENNLLSLSYGNIIKKDINTTDGLLPKNFEGYNIVDKNDIVLRLTDLQNDHKSLRVGLAKEKGIITSAYISLRSKLEVNSLFMYYLLHSFDICKGFYGMGAGVRQGLTFDGMKLFQFVMPPVHEQTAIVCYLEEKATKIDRLIIIKKGLLAELESYKKSIIYEAVTGKKEIK